VKKHSAQGGIAITASHNPPEWNAMKFVDGDGMFLSAAKAAQFLASVNDPITWVDWQKVGTLTHDSAAISYHINKVLEIGYLDLGRIRSKRFRVVLDSVNGAGGLALPCFLSGLDAR